MSFTELSTEKTVCGHGVYTNFYTHFPHLLFGLDDILFKRYTQNDVQICELFENQCSGSCNFPTGINEITFTQSTRQHDFLKNATLQSATFLTLIFLK